MSTEPLTPLRVIVWSAQHDATCDDGMPHSWTEHLPWDDVRTEEDAAKEADAIIHALDAARAAQDVAGRESVLTTITVDRPHSHDIDQCHDCYALTRKRQPATPPPDALRDEIERSINEAIEDEDSRDAIAWKMGWRAAMYALATPEQRASEAALRAQGVAPTEEA
jgi:hypothetical protein